MLTEALEHFSSTTNILLCIAVGVCFIVALVPYLWFLFNTPGPWGVPLLGYYPFLHEDMAPQLQELAKKHGDVYIINIAGENFVHLGSIKALREAHVTKTEYFPFRSTKYSMLKYCVPDGFTYMKGETWRIQRKHFVQSMREIGLVPNKEELKGPIGDAVRSTIDTLSENQEEPIDVASLLSKECTASVIRLFLGDAVSEDEATRLNESYLKMVGPMSVINLMLLGTISRYLILPWIQGRSQMLEGKEEMEALLHKIVSDHKANFDLNQQPRDLIDLYLRERAVREKKGDPQAKYFTDSSLVSNLMQVYGDGSVGIGLLVAMFLHNLSHHPNAQDSIFEEIIRVIGTERSPTWENRTELPLTHSAVKELFRTTKFFPVSPSQECVEDTTVLGVHVPKGCITLVNTWAIHHNPNIYKDPHKFDINRFLPGKAKEEDPVSFGLGKRSCAGEGLAMTEIFTFLASLLQNFLFLPAPQEKQQKNNHISLYEDALKKKLLVITRSPTEKSCVRNCTS